MWSLTRLVVLRDMGGPEDELDSDFTAIEVDEDQVFLVTAG